MAWFCGINLTTMQINLSNPVTATINADGSVTMPSWGFFVVDTEANSISAVAYFYGTTFRPCNAVMTTTAYDGGATASYGVIVTQDYRNRLSFENLVDQGQPMYANLTPDGRLELDPQYVGYNSTYGELDLMAMTTSGGGDMQTLLTATGASDGRSVTFPAWGVFALSSPTKYLRRFASSVLTLDTAVTYPTAPAASFSGSGTEGDPFIISTYDQLQALAYIVNSGADQTGVHYRLGADIDCTGSDWYFTPIGRVDGYTQYFATNAAPSGAPFNGTLDGDGHAIKNYRLVTGYDSYTGLVAWLGSAGTVKNLTVSGAYIVSDAMGVSPVVALNYGYITDVSSTNCQAACGQYLLGGIAGCNRGTISGCSAYNTLVGYGNMGGIAGGSTGTITGCMAYGSQTFYTVSNSLYAEHGGLVGSINGSWCVSGHPALLEKSYTAAIMSTSSNAAETGGIAGSVISGTAYDAARVDQCFSMATISSRAADSSSGSSGRVGALAGTVYGGQITNCYAAGLVLAPLAPTYASGVIAYYMDADKNKIDCVYSAAQIYSSGTENPPVEWCVCPNLTAARLAKFTNVYYDRQIMGLTYDANDYAGALTTKEMTAAAGLSGFDSDVWTFTAGIYPRLTALKDLPAAAISTAAMLLPDGETTRMTKSDFTVSTDLSVCWGVMLSSGLGTEGSGLTIDGSKVTLKGEYATDYMLAYRADQPFLKEYMINTVPSSIWEGRGTEENPYLLKTVDDLKNLADGTTTQATNYQGVYFRVANDIDCKADPDFKGIAADGNSSHTFQGSIDGDGHTIDNIVFDNTYYNLNTGAAQSGNSNVQGSGFIGILGTHGSVKNLTIGSGCEMTAFSYLGAIVGKCYGTVEGCSSYATLTVHQNYGGGIVGYSFYDTTTKRGAVITDCYHGGAVTLGNNYAGGIAGYAYGATIERCQNDGTVTCDSITPYNTAKTGKYAGGIVGYLTTNSTYASVIRHCVNNGTITSLDYTGGITGQSNSQYITFEGCINNGLAIPKSSTATTGGVVGYMSSTTSFSPACCYYNCQTNPYGGLSRQSMTGINPLGTAALTSGASLAGIPDSIMNYQAGLYPVLAQFADRTPCRAMRAIAFAPAGQQTRLDLSADATLSQAEGMTWTLAQADTVYAIDGATLTVGRVSGSVPAQNVLTGSYLGYSVSYPIQSIPVPYKGDGTAESPYEIWTIADMATLSEFTNDFGAVYTGKYFRLMADLDYQGVTDYVPVARVDSKAPFDADFDGASHTISNLHIERSDCESALFGAVGPGGCIHHLTLTGGWRGAASGATSKGAAAFVYNLYGSVTDCVNRDAVENTVGNYGATFAYRAYNGARIARCVNYATVKARTGYEAGIVSYMEDGSTVSDCVNYADFEASANYAAGIAARSYGSVIRCTNYGTISSTGKHYLGGIVAAGYDSMRVAACENFGPVNSMTTGYYVGGIVGYISGKAAIDSCTNHADVCNAATSTAYLGGILGYATKTGTRVTDCTNYGSVTCNAAGKNVGGIVGYLYSGSDTDPFIVARCYNHGNVTGAGQYVAGIAGYTPTGSRLVDCGNYGDVTTTGTTATFTAGVVGYGYADLTRCFNAGRVTSEALEVSGLIGSGYGCEVTECFNIGDVSTTAVSSKNSTVGAAGLCALGRPYLTDCYNMGAVTAPTYACGLGGYFTTNFEISRCYNAGTVTSTSDDNATAYPLLGTWNSQSSDTQSVFADNSYDVTANPSLANNLPVVGSPMKWQEYLTLDLGEAWDNTPGAYPTLRAFAADTIANFYAASVLLAESDTTLSLITDPVTIPLLIGVEWTCTEPLTITGSSVSFPVKQPTATATLTKTAGREGAAPLRRTYEITGTCLTGIDTLIYDMNADVEYYNLQGIRVLHPSRGFYIMRRGTSARTVYVK